MTHAHHGQRGTFLWFPSVTRLVLRLWPECAATVFLVIVSMLVAPDASSFVCLVYIACVSPELCKWDLRQLRLPNHLVYPGYIVAGIACCCRWVQTGDFPLGVLVSGVCYVAALGVLWATGGMGMGDVKLAGCLGIAGGFLGVPVAVTSPVLAFGFGGLYAVVTLATGATRTTSIPFGPFLLAGFWGAVVLCAPR